MMVMPGGKLIYVSVEKREDFDLIALPETDHRSESGRVLAKAIDADADVYVVFQHWLEWIPPSERVKPEQPDA